MEFLEHYLEITVKTRPIISYFKKLCPILRFLGYGLATELNYDKWRHNRTLLNPVFHKK